MCSIYLEITESCILRTMAGDVNVFIKELKWTMGPQVHFPLPRFPLRSTANTISTD